MRVVIAGDMNVDAKPSKQRVHDVLDALKVKYNDLMIVTSGCDRGVGRLIKVRCIEHERDNVEFVEFAVFPWANVPSVKLAQIYLCANAALMELGEEFHIFKDKSFKHGYTSDLIYRIRNASHRPLLSIYE